MKFHPYRLSKLNLVMLVTRGYCVFTIPSLLIIISQMETTLKNLFIWPSVILIMKIKETLMDRSFSVGNSDPYMLSLKAMESLSKDVKVVERKNSYETDGPHHRSVVVFDTIDLIDDFSKIVFHFDLLGEDGLLRVNVNGLLSLNVEETGFFSQIFNDYYVKTVFPLLRKVSEKKIEFFSDRVESLFGQL